MNYKALFEKSWSLIWKHPPLWVFVLLMGRELFMTLLRAWAHAEPRYVG